MSKIIKFVGIFSALAILLTIFSFSVFSRNTKDAAAEKRTEDNSGRSYSKGISNIGLTASSVSQNASGSNDASSVDKLMEAIILYVGSPITYVNGTKSQIDPANIEITPFITDNIAMVPIRFISESLGGSVGWDQKSRTATIVLGSKSYNFTQGSTTMTVGNVKYPLGVAVQAIQGRTFVPLDKFVEILGKKAFYDRGLIIISDSGNAFETDKDKAIISEWIAKLSYLPVVGSRDKLLSLLEEGENNGYLRYGGLNGKGIILDEANGIQFTGKVGVSATDAGAAASSQKTAEAVSGDKSAK